MLSLIIIGITIGIELILVGIYLIGIYLNNMGYDMYYDITNREIKR